MSPIVPSAEPAAGAPGPEVDLDVAGGRIRLRLGARQLAETPLSDLVGDVLRLCGIAAFPRLAPVLALLADRLEGLGLDLTLYLSSGGLAGIVSHPAVPGLALQLSALTDECNQADRAPDDPRPTETWFRLHPQPEER